MWLTFALFFAFWSSVSVSISKRILKDTTMSVFLAFNNICIILAMFFILFFRGMPKIDNVFLIMTFIAGLINIFTSLAVYKAIKIAPISLLAPLSAFNPVATTILASFFLRENLALSQIFGILLIVLGCYFLNIADVKKGIFAPFQSLFQNRGVQLYLLANILWAITPIFEKTAIMHTTPKEPLFVSFGEGLFLTVVFTAFIAPNIKTAFFQFKKNALLYILPAPISALSLWGAFTAFSLTNVGSVTAIFKLSALFTIFLGWLFFKEKRIKERFLGAGIMVLGTIFLVV